MPFTPESGMYTAWYKSKKIKCIKIHICDMTDSFITSCKPTLKIYKCKILTSKRTSLWIFLQVISYFSNIHADLLNYILSTSNKKAIFCTYAYGILLQYYSIHYRSVMAKSHLAILTDFKIGSEPILNNRFKHKKIEHLKFSHVSKS